MAEASGTSESESSQHVLTNITIEKIEYHNHYGDVIHKHSCTGGSNTKTSRTEKGLKKNTVDPISELDLQQLSKFVEDGSQALIHADGEVSRFVVLYEKEVSDLSDEIRKEWGKLLSIIGKLWKTILKRIKRDIQQQSLEGEDRVKKALAAICLHLKGVSLDSNKEQDDCLISFVNRIKDVMNMGNALSGLELNIHAIICFYAAARLHQISAKRNYSVLGIKETIEKLTSLVKKITKDDESLKQVITEYVIPLLLEMADMLTVVEGADSKVKIDNEIWCLYNIALCYHYCGVREKSIEVNQSAIKLMKDEYENKAQTYRVFGHCYHNAALAHSESNEYVEAIQLYKLALEAYNKATDWANDEHKNKRIGSTEEYIKRLETLNKKYR